MDEQMSMFANNPEYEAFVKKFAMGHKMTTDDCYTPPRVYDAVKKWACTEYGIDPLTIVRPFYPGGNYENFAYNKDTVVLDNPPFSILSKICNYYISKGIKFFLFGPSLTSFTGKLSMNMCHIFTDTKITYHNGAIVQTGFLTNMDVAIARTAPKLREMVEKAQDKGGKTKVKNVYPENVLTASMLQRYAKNGIDYRIKKEDCVIIETLDAQRGQNTKIFGRALLISERAAAEKAAAERTAAERTAAHVWELSEREKEIIKSLGE